MSPEYKYAGEPLSTIATMDFLKKVSTKDEGIKEGHTLETLMRFVEKNHTEKGGLPTDPETLRRILRRALGYLCNSGHAVKRDEGCEICQPEVPPETDDVGYGSEEDFCPDCGCEAPYDLYASPNGLVCGCSPLYPDLRPSDLPSHPCSCNIIQYEFLYNRTYAYCSFVA